MSADFIHVAPEVLDAQFCQMVAERFMASPRRAPGRVGSGYDPDLKRSTDLGIDEDGDWQDVSEHLQGRLRPQLLAYVRKFPHVVLGGISPRIRDPRSGREQIVDGAFARMLSDQNLGTLVDGVVKAEPINLQHYAQGTEGFPHWHSEIYPCSDSTDALRRVLFFMFYLNDVAEGGETEFLYQQRAIRPRRGTLVLAPAGFTHTHRGKVPLSGPKLIATSWISFRPLHRPRT